MTYIYYVPEINELYETNNDELFLVAFDESPLYTVILLGEI